MPGVIMENGNTNGLHTNHDRQVRQNGVNGATQHLQMDKLQNTVPSKAEPQQNMTPTSPSLPNGTFTQDGAKTHRSEDIPHKAEPSKISSLPPELAHMTMGYVPWANLLTRQTQRTFVGMTSVIQALAEMPIPSARANGYNPQNSSADDNSQENLNKKLHLLRYLEGAHADWAKQLALAQWSRKAEEVSRLVDLQTHLREEKWLYDSLIGTLCESKRGLLGAALPNPDLRTALEVLSTGTVSWMPELGYIPPAPLDALEILNQLEELNTLLSIRLNVHEHETLPFHFRDYAITSGRITFKVPGEFDVDLAVASEDPETQFWFIDLRFTFSPRPADMDRSLRSQIEQKINDVLLRDGLSGCYKYLHEMVLTRKILELRKQALELSRGRWVDGLRTEQLNRAVSIQYWVDRYARGPKSWIVLGVHSGISKGGQTRAEDTSRLSLVWFRDGKKADDENIQFDVTNLSTERLLESVIARHVNHILKHLYDQLRTRPILAMSDSSLDITMSMTDPAESVLKIQLTHSTQITVKIEPITGRFILGPALPRVAEAESKLNSNSQDPVNDAHTYIDLLRCTLLTEDILRHAASVGWQRIPGPKFRPEALRPLIPKDTMQTVWFSRPGWLPDWHLAVTLGMSGEEWWLFESYETAPGRAIGNHICVPIESRSPIPSYAFMSTLNVFVAAILTNFANTKMLHRNGALHAVQIADAPKKGILLPSVYARLSQLLPSKNNVARTGKSWAKDVIRISFQGLESLPDSSVSSSPLETLPVPNADSQDGSLSQPLAMAPLKSQIPQNLAVVITEAKMLVPLPKSITNINAQIDRDIAFHASSGAFAFRLRSRVGEAVIPALIERIIRVERLVEYVQVLQSHEPQLKCETVTLGMISFTYTTDESSTLSGKNDIDSELAKRYRGTIEFGNVEKITLVLSQGDPHLRVLDLLNQILNSPQGFTGVAKLLPITAPALRGLSVVEDKWSYLSDIGECYILVRAGEWYVLRYIINQTQDGTDLPTIPRQFNFSLKLQDRKGSPFWHLQRIDGLDREGDDLERALQKVWNAVGEKWLGMRLSGVATPAGIEALLLAVDEVVRTVASAPTTLPISSNSVVQAPMSQGQAVGIAKQPQRPPTQHQRPQGNSKQQLNGQRQTSNQTQGGGSSNFQGKEVVVLD